MTGADTSKTAPRVRVIIVNYNGGPYLVRAVDALLGQTASGFDVVVADNGSSDGSLENLPADPRLTILRLGANLGFAAGNNRAAEGFAGEFLAFLNPDAIPAPDWLNRLLTAADAAPQVALFGSTLLMAEDTGRYDGTGDCLTLWGAAWRRDYGKPVQTPHPCRPAFGVSAAAALIRRDAFEAVGGFMEAFFCYLEDVDLSFRLRLAGFDVAQAGDAVALHHGSAIAGRGSDFSIFHSLRNQLWLMAGNSPALLLPLALILTLAWQLVQAGKLLAAGRGRLAVRAVTASLAGLPAALGRRAAIHAKATASTGAILAALTLDPRLQRRR